MGADFYYDVMSPYAWLAAERVDELIPGVRWRPVLVGAIFGATGRSSWGLSEARAEGIAEVEGRAGARKLGAMRWPPDWPSDSLAAMRVATWADRDGHGPAFALAAMRAAFLDGRSLSEPSTLAAAAIAAGLDPDAALASTQDPEIKAALRATTDEAIARGVVGVPTVVTADGTVVWGDDHVEDAAAS